MIKQTPKSPTKDEILKVSAGYYLKWAELRGIDWVTKRLSGHPEMAKLVQEQWEASRPRGDMNVENP